MSRPRSPIAQRLGLIVGLLLVALHLDAWREQRVVMYAGWIPEELAYRLVWMLAAWIFLLWLCEPYRRPPGRTPQETSRSASEERRP